MAKIIIGEECDNEEKLEKARESRRKWYHRNKEKAQESQQRRREADPEKYRKYYREYLQKWRKENPKKSREDWLKRKYNITLADYDFLLESQGNVCAICGMTPEENGRRLSVDHDHETGEVRGLLCNNCNFMLGNAQDDPVVLARGIEYLLNWRNNDRTIIS